MLLAGEEGGDKSKIVFSGLGISAVYKFIADGLRLFPSEIDWSIKAYPGSGIGMDVLPSLVGVGYICGAKVSSYLLSGAVLGWFVIMPLLVLIGERTAEMIKIAIGSVWTREERKYIDVKGRCLIEGLPKMIRVWSDEMIEALDEPITSIVEAVCSVIERTPPELIGDVVANGIVMTGGGSLLYGLDYLITNVTGIPTRVADKAVSCVALGTGKSLDNISMIPEGAINISRTRTEQQG